MSASGRVLDDLARITSAGTVAVTPDDTDVAAIERKVASAYRDALAKDERQQWDDRGWMLAWPAALLVLLWFRRGWTMRWSLLIIAGLTGLPNHTAHADGLIDWFFTADQQGRLTFEEKEFAEAADLFEAPDWKGYALYRAGRCGEAPASRHVHF